MVETKAMKTVRAPTCSLLFALSLPLVAQQTGTQVEVDPGRRVTGDRRFLHIGYVGDGGNGVLSITSVDPPLRTAFDILTDESSTSEP
ncbi:MAG TPA: hypothetical protein VIN93_06460 [Bryobacteraceae bacterium]